MSSPSWLLVWPQPAPKPGSVEPSRADQQASVNINGRLFQQLSLGSSVKVIFLPEEKDEAYLFDDVKDYSPWSMTSAGLLFCAIGAAVAFYAQKKRTASA